jgi:beta-fructofuranosidase
MSRSLKGPWLTPQRDDFDGHAFYAAKSASNGKSRFLFGWNPTRSGEKDNGSWNWGGNLVVHELFQQPDGELAVRMPSSVSNVFSRKLEINFSSGDGKYSTHDNTLQLSANGTFAAAAAGALPALCKIEATIKYEKGAREFGLMFRTSEDFDKSYYIRFEPLSQRVVFDKWPRENSEVYEIVELARPLQMAAGDELHVQMIIEGNKGVAYFNDHVAMNFRAYDLPEGNWGFFSTDGNVSVSNIAIAVRS